MYCPYCGKKNDDSSKYCAGCGRYIKENPDFSNQNQSQSAGPEPSDGSGNGSGNRNKIYIIVIIIVVAAAVVAILFLTDVLHWPSRDRNNHAITDERHEEAETEDEKVTEEEDAEEVKEETEEESDKITDDNQDDNVTEQQTPSGAKTTAEYTIETKHASAKDSNGNIVCSADYELVILEGDDGVNQKINDSLKQDCQDFFNDYGCSEDEETVDNYSTDNIKQEVSIEADVVYNKYGVLSIFYEVWNENSETTHSNAYGLTYSLETGDQMRITDLAIESDANVLEKIKEALRVDQSAGYLAGSEEQINSLTLNDIDNEANGLGLHFIIEGGEIVLVVTVGKLFLSSSGFLKVPIDVYISTMSYDEYTEDYIFPNSSTDELNSEDLEGLSKEESRLARNEIFARHGRIYEDENLNAYFSKRDWYNGTLSQEDFDQSVFNDTEWHNLGELNKYDEVMGYQNIGEL